MKNPEFATTPVNACAQVSTANSNRDGSGTIADVYTAPTNGARLDFVTLQALVTTTAGMLRLYVNDETNTRLYLEVPVPAITVSATVQAFRTRLKLDLLLPNGYKLRASTEKGETFNVFAEGGSF